MALYYLQPSFFVGGAQPDAPASRSIPSGPAAVLTGTGACADGAVSDILTSIYATGTGISGNGWLDMLTTGINLSGGDVGGDSADADLMTGTGSSEWSAEFSGEFG